MSTAAAEEVVVRDGVYGIELVFQQREERRYGYWSQYASRRGSGYVRHPKRETPDGPSVVFVFPEGESILDNLLDRHDRPWKVWKPMVEQALRQMGVEFEKLAWRQRYWCDCPCSPCFVVIGGKGPGYNYSFTAR